MTMTSKTIKFVTDSVADIPDRIVSDLDITVVPCYVNYDGNSYADDGVALVREEYYRQLKTMDKLPTTSAMSPEVAREYIAPVFDDADHVVLITTPATLSGIYNAFRLALQDFPEANYTLINSTSMSIGIGWQVMNGVEVANETGSIEKTIAAVNATREHLIVYAMIDTLNFLRRSGRVGWAAAGVGQLLQIKPIVQVIDSEINSIVRARTFSRALAKMAELSRQHKPLDRAAILHTSNDTGMNELKLQLADILPKQTITGLIGPALGTHIGPGAVGIAAVRKGWKDAITT